MDDPRWPPTFTRVSYFSLLCRLNSSAINSEFGDLMSDITTEHGTHAAAAHRRHGHHHRHAPRLDTRPPVSAIIIFLGLLIGGVLFAVYGLTSDIGAAGIPALAAGAFVLLGVALLIALGFEFVNGFHDTANAVATVIYTHSLPAQAAVLWSGCWNLIGVITSSGAVAFGIISLLPVELILQVGSNAGFAMIFALLIAAIHEHPELARDIGALAESRRQAMAALQRGIARAA